MGDQAWRLDRGPLSPGAGSGAPGPLGRQEDFLLGELIKYVIWMEGDLISLFLYKAADVAILFKFIRIVPAGRGVGGQWY